MSFAPSDLKRGFGQKPEIELSGTLKKEHNDQSPHVVTSQQGGEGVGVAFHASKIRSTAGHTDRFAVID